MKIKLLVFVCALLFTGCATKNYEPNKWHYQGPDHVNCNYDRELMKVCRKIGPYWICECMYA